MSGAFAKGTYALAMCQRCGFPGKYLDMVEDGHTPGLIVHPECREIRHPAERQFDAKDPQVLKRPSPDNDDDSVGDSGQSLAEAMGFDTYFGGGT